MTSAVRIGVAGIGITSPLGEQLESNWERLIAGSGAVGSMSFDGLVKLPRRRLPPMSRKYSAGCSKSAPSASA